MTDTGTFFYAFLHFSLSVSEIEAGASQWGQKKEAVTFLLFIVLCFFPLLKCFSTHTLALALKCRRDVNVRPAQRQPKKCKQAKKKKTHNSVKRILTKRKHQKLRRLDAAAGSKLVTKKIGQFCVCLFHKALISSFISSSTCGCLPAGLVVVAPHVDTHSHTHPGRENR